MLKALGSIGLKRKKIEVTSNKRLPLNAVHSSRKLINIHNKFKPGLSAYKSSSKNC